MLIAQSGSIAPFPDSLITLGNVFVPVLNDRGDVLFGGLVEPEPRGGLWLHTNNGLSLAIRSSDPAPGLSDSIFATYEAWLTNDRRIAVSGYLRGGAIGSESVPALYTGEIGNLALVVRSGIPAPATTQGTTFNFRLYEKTIALGESGDVAVQSGAMPLNPSINGIWTGSPGALIGAAVTGQSIAGVEAGTTYQSLSDIRINKNNQMVFRTYLQGPNVGYGNWAVITGTGNSMSVAARSGEESPDVPGIKYWWFGAPSIAASGDIAFTADLVGPAVDGATNVGMWAGPKENLKLVAREGFPVPGFEGYRFVGLSFQPAINSAGQVAFAAATRRTDNTISGSVWVGGSGDLSRIVQSEEHAPGTPTDVLFSGFLDLVINESGQVAFVAEMKGPGISSGNRRGIWAGTAGNLHLLVRQGQLLDADPGPGIVPKEVSSFEAELEFRGDDGWTRSFNNKGQLAFQVKFTDGTTAVYLATLPSILRGDADNNNVVDYHDFLALYENFGRGSANRTMGDFNDDGTVSFADFQILERNFGQSLDGSAQLTPEQASSTQAFATGQPTPEPAGFALLAAALAACGRERRYCQTAPRSTVSS